MRARATTIALVVVAALGTGCMSITTNTTLLSDSSQLGAPYSGTRADLHMLVCFARDVSRNASSLLLAPLMLLPLIDLPLSFVLDTLLLPFDLALEPERAAQVIGARAGSTICRRQRCILRLTNGESRNVGGYDDQSK